MFELYIFWIRTNHNQHIVDKSNVALYTFAMFISCHTHIITVYIYNKKKDQVPHSPISSRVRSCQMYAEHVQPMKRNDFMLRTICIPTFHIMSCDNVAPKIHLRNKSLSNTIISRSLLLAFFVFAYSYM